MTSSSWWHGQCCTCWRPRTLWSNQETTWSHVSLRSSIWWTWWGPSGHWSCVLVLMFLGCTSKLCCRCCNTLGSCCPEKRLRRKQVSSFWVEIWESCFWSSKGSQLCLHRLLLWCLHLGWRREQYTIQCEPASSLLHRTASSQLSSFEP